MGILSGAVEIFFSGKGGSAHL